MPKSNQFSILGRLPNVIYKRKTSRYFYYNDFAKKYSLEHFKQNFQPENLLVISHNELKFHNIIDFGVSIDYILKTFGKPILKKTHTDNPHIKTLIYKTKIAGIGSKSVLIFYRNKLILFNYVFDGISSRNRRILFRYCHKKFGIAKTPTSVQVKDSAQSTLIIKEKNDSLIFNFYTTPKELDIAFNNKPPTKVRNLRDYHRLAKKSI